MRPRCCLVRIGHADEILLNYHARIGPQSHDRNQRQDWSTPNLSPGNLQSLSRTSHFGPVETKCAILAADYVQFVPAVNM